VGELTADVSLRPMTRDDLSLLARWLESPHVHEWWREPFSPDAVEAEYGPTIDGTDPTKVFVISVDGRLVGIIQRYRNADNPEWAAAMAVVSGGDAAASIDFLIGEPDAVGRGVGAAAIAAFTPMVFDAYPEVSAVLAAPQQANVASWRALEKAGFVREWEGTLDSDDPSDSGPAYVYARYRARRLVGVYDADGGIVGELRYVVGRTLRGTHCSLCDITHGRVRPKPEWNAFVARLGVPFDLFHRNEQPVEGQVPLVLAEVDNRFVPLLGPAELENTHGDVAAFAETLRAAADRHGIAIGS